MRREAHTKSTAWQAVAAYAHIRARLAHLWVRKSHLLIPTTLFPSPSTHKRNCWLVLLCVCVCVCVCVCFGQTHDFFPLSICPFNTLPNVRVRVRVKECVCEHVSGHWQLLLCFVLRLLPGSNNKQNKSSGSEQMLWVLVVVLLLCCCCGEEDGQPSTVVCVKDCSQE